MGLGKAETEACFVPGNPIFLGGKRERDSVPEWKRFIL